LFVEQNAKTMQAEIKINYAEATKGQAFRVVEIQGKRVTLDINGREVDFGYSEVQIIAPTDDDLTNLGHDLLMMGKRSIQGWKEKDVTGFINQISLPMTKSLKRRSINKAIWG